MRESTRPTAQGRFGRVSVGPRWLLPSLLPIAILSGVALAYTSASISREFGPPAGPPDTLAATGIALPKGPALFEPRYLSRLLSDATGRSALVEGYAARYHITRPLARSIVDASVEQGIDPELAFRLIRVESVFDAKAVSPGGAVGLMQLMPGTADDIDPTVDSMSELLDPRTNMRLGLINLRLMIERYDGDVRLGVLAYNRGEVAVDRALRRGKDPENGYSVLVLGPRAHGGKPYTGTGLLRRASGTSSGPGFEP